MILNWQRTIATVDVGLSSLREAIDMEPKTRLEKWLAKIAGESIEITPTDRLEKLLAKIAGESVEITPR